LDNENKIKIENLQTKLNMYENVIFDEHTPKEILEKYEELKIKYNNLVDESIGENSWKEMLQERHLKLLDDFKNMETEFNKNKNILETFAKTAAIKMNEMNYFVENLSNENNQLKQQQIYSNFGQNLQEFQQILQTKDFHIQDLSKKLNDAINMFNIMQNENYKLKNQMWNLQQFYNNEILKVKSFMIDKKYYEELLKKYNDLEDKIKNNEMTKQYDEYINDMEIKINEYKEINDERQSEIIKLSNEIQSLENELTKKDIDNKEILKQKNEEIKQTIQKFKKLSIKINKDKHKKQKILDAQLDEDNYQLYESYKKIKKDEDKTPTKIKNFIDKLDDSNKKLQQIIDKKEPIEEQKQEQQPKSQLLSDEFKKQLPDEIKNNIKKYVVHHSIKPINIYEYFDKNLNNLTSKINKNKENNQKNIDLFKNGMKILNKSNNEHYSQLIINEIKMLKYKDEKYNELFANLENL